MPPASAGMRPEPAEPGSAQPRSAHGVLPPTQGGAISDELVALANDACYQLRKSWGMHGQISVGFLAIGVDELTLEVSTSEPRWRGFDLPETVRNTLVRFFRDLLPVPIVRVIYTNEADGVEEDVRFLPFYSEALVASRPSTAPLTLIDEVCERSRAENRRAFEAAWKEVTS